MRYPAAPWRLVAAAAASLPLLGSPGPARAQSAETLLQEGFFQEVGRCDPRGAIATYLQVLRLEELPAEQAAQAHLRLGVCYDLLGELQRSQEHLRVVVESYPGVAGAARAARRRLEHALPADPARFMPPDVLFYAELVDPPRQVRRLAHLLEGTPFQNPVDYHLAYLAGLAEGGDRGAEDPGRPRREVEQVAAFLNRAFLEELQLVRGLALGFPAGGQPGRDYLAVFFPGESNVFRGLLPMVVAMERPQAHGSVRNLALYGFPRRQSQDGGPEPATYLALGEDVMAWGRPRRLVEEAVERYFSGTASLATHPPFRRSRPRGSDTLAFAFAGDGCPEALAALARPRAPERFDALEDLLGWDRLFPLAVTLEAEDARDRLSLAIHTSFPGPEPPLLWRALRSGPCDPEVLRVIPRDAPLYAAAGAGETDARREAIALAAARLAAAAGEEGEEIRQARDRLAPLLDGPALRRLLEGLRSGAVALVPGPPADRSVLVALRLGDPRAAEEIAGAALTELCFRATGTRASQRVETEEVSALGERWTVHTVHPLPGLGLSYAALGDVVVFSSSSEAVRRALEAAAEPERRAGEVEVGGASKLLVMRPPALWELLPAAERPAPLDEVVRNVRRVILLTREGEEFRVELQVPEITRTLRDILNALGREREG